MSSLGLRTSFVHRKSCVDQPDQVNIRNDSVHPSPLPRIYSSIFSYSENWIEGIRGAIHEVGHALYEQGRPGGDAEDLPVARALSVGVHESQVRRSLRTGGRNRRTDTAWHERQAAQRAGEVSNIPRETKRRQTLLPDN